MKMIKKEIDESIIRKVVKLKTKINDLQYEYDNLLEELNKKGIKWGLSNVFSNKGNENTHLIKWCNDNNWNVHHLNMNYSALGKGNANSDEVYICNYDYIDYTNDL